MGYFTDKKILIIGGTGTIGQGLVDELINQKPEVIRIFSRDEFKQYQMEYEIKDKKRFRFLIGDVRDYERVERAMSNVDVVFNLAAMKHVPACEYNPEEAIKTNVIGMENVIKAAIHHNVESVLFTSSDKAINPTNSYGATKLLAEKLVQSANFSKGTCRTRFTAVRFGNVMGSRGSVINLFRKQITEEHKVTITDPEMTRFMMSLNQAVRLIMNATENSLGGEVFVLKMPVIKLIDFTEVIVEEICKEIGIDKQAISMEVVGLRAGERKFEELMTKEEAEGAYDMGDMFSVLPTIGSESLFQHYQKYSCVEKVSYNSADTCPISKDDVRALLKSTGLV